MSVSFLTLFNSLKITAYNSARWLLTWDASADDVTIISQSAFSPADHDHDDDYEEKDHTHTTIVNADGNTVCDFENLHIVQCLGDLKHGGGVVFRPYDEVSANDSVIEFYTGDGSAIQCPLYIRHSDYGPNCIVFPNNSIILPIAYSWQTFASSVDWKENIETLSSPVEQIKKLEGIRFRHKKPGTEIDGIEDVGITFEDLESLGLPGLVNRDRDGKPEGMNMSKIIPLLVEAVKAQESRIEALEKEVFK